MFFIVSYIPHKGRKRESFTLDTIEKIRELLTTMCKTDCVIWMGDFNCELQRHVKDCTGKWCMTKRQNNGHGSEILDLMWTFDLFVVDTLFKLGTYNSGSCHVISELSTLPQGSRTEALAPDIPREH